VEEWIRYLVLAVTRFSSPETNYRFSVLDQVAREPEKTCGKNTNSQLILNTKKTNAWLNKNGFSTILVTGKIIAGKIQKKSTGTGLYRRSETIRLRRVKPSVLQRWTRENPITKDL